MVPDPDSEPGPDDSSDVGSNADGSSETRFTFLRHVSRILDRPGELLPFALVPFVLSVAHVERTRRALDPPSGWFSINFEFVFPTPLLDLWSFADPPDPPTDDPSEMLVGGSDTASGSHSFDVTFETPFDTVALPLEGVDGELAAWFGLVLLAHTVIGAVIAAGYLGGLDRRLRRRPVAILDSVVRFAPRIFLYHLVLYAAFALLVPLFVIAPPLILIGMIGLLVFGYLFYAVPFLFVVDDANFLEAFRRSAGFATGEASYFWFALGHGLLAVIVSPVVSGVLSAGGIGFVIAVAIATPFALVMTAATVSFVQELVDDGSTRGEPDRETGFGDDGGRVDRRSGTDGMDDATESAGRETDDARERFGQESTPDRKPDDDRDG
ncbi:hypothetical protein AB7C87_23245 [Natrarchaeobius sp. A-rgal3]|uniref:hypothetical protein n=1 Tax=Natrarchaeobius versutus TaxID=1679078 RepID=UPI00350F8E33